MSLQPYYAKAVLKSLPSEGLAKGREVNPTNSFIGLTPVLQRLSSSQIVTHALWSSRFVALIIVTVINHDFGEAEGN